MNSIENDDAKNSPSYSESFDRWWKVLPIKKGKPMCFKIWQKKKLDSLVDNLINDVQERIQRDVYWIRGFIPHPSTYLNQERWGDDIVEMTLAERLGVIGNPDIVNTTLPLLINEYGQENIEMAIRDLQLMGKKTYINVIVDHVIEINAKKSMSCIQKDDLFFQWWSIYPVKHDELGARKIWIIQKLDTLFHVIFEGTQYQAQFNSRWLSGYAPSPVNFLKNERWNDLTSFTQSQVDKNDEAFESYLKNQK